MTLYGPDISNNNWSNVDELTAFLSQLAGEGFSWVEAKCSEGNYYSDPYWAPTLAWCQANNFLCVPYHYVTTDDPAQQAAQFVGNGGGTVAMLDFEANSGDISNFWGVVDAFNAAGVQIALSYIPNWYWQQIGSPDLSQVPGLIASAYPSTASGYASVLYEDGGGGSGSGWTPYGNAQPVIWQFTDAANVAGVSVDCNAFQGAPDQLAAVLAGTAPAPAPAPPPPPPPAVQHIVLTVSGTGVDMWNPVNPQPAGIASALAANFPNTYLWQPVGDYPASVFPMGPSVQDGIDSLIYLTTGVPIAGSNTTVPGPNYPANSLILLGYSQGASVVCGFIQWLFVNNRTDVLQRIVCVGVWGNPMRLPGFASGNEFAGWPMPADVDGYVTGGIAGPGTSKSGAGAGCMTAEQVQPQLKTPVTHYWGDFVNTIGQGNDLYADCPTGPSPVTLDGEAHPGSAETLIYEIVQNVGVEDLPELELQLSRLFGAEQLPEVIAIGEAVINGGMFLVAGPNAAHYTYDTTPIYNFISLAGSETPPWN